MPSGYWSKAPTANARLQENESRKCSVRGCHRNRKGYNSCCSYHRLANVRYGSGSAQRIPVSLLNKLYEEELKPFVDVNLEHPLYLHVANSIDRMLKAAQSGSAVKLAHQWKRLADYGVTAADVIARAAAVYYMLALEGGERYMPDRNSIVTQVGHNVLLLAPAYTSQRTSKNGKIYQKRDVPSGGQRRAMGQVILDMAEALLAKVAMYGLRMREERERRESARDVEFLQP
jgi:hypothetical protein